MKKLIDRQKLDVISMLIPELNIPKWASIIYKISHPHKGCPHQDWEEEAIKIYKNMKRNKIL